MPAAGRTIDSAYRRIFWDCAHHWPCTVHRAQCTVPQATLCQAQFTAAAAGCQSCGRSATVSNLAVSVGGVAICCVRSKCSNCTSLVARRGSDACRCIPVRQVGCLRTSWQVKTYFCPQFEPRQEKIFFYPSSTTSWPTLVAHPATQLCAVLFTVSKVAGAWSWPLTQI